MSLVPCPECSTPVSHKAPNCPNCGEPDPSRRKRNSKWLMNLILFAMILLACGYAWFVLIPDIRTHGLFNNISQNQ